MTIRTANFTFCHFIFYLLKRETRSDHSGYGIAFHSTNMVKLKNFGVRLTTINTWVLTQEQSDEVPQDEPFLIERPSLCCVCSFRIFTSVLDSPSVRALLTSALKEVGPLSPQVKGKMWQVLTTGTAATRFFVSKTH